MYPIPDIDANLNTMRLLADKTGLPVGYSDHSGSIYPSIGALTLGSNLIEVHITFDKKMLMRNTM